MRKEWYFASERANFIILSQTSAVACAILDRTHVVSGGCDNVVIIWERYDAKLLQRLVGHSGHIGALHMNSRLIASGSADRSIRLWSRADGQCLRVFEGHRSNVVCLQFDDHKLVSGSADQTIRVVGPPGAWMCSSYLQLYFEHVSFFHAGLVNDDWRPSIQSAPTQWSHLAIEI